MVGFVPIAADGFGDDLIGRVQEIAGERAARWFVLDGEARVGAFAAKEGDARTAALVGRTRLVSGRRASGDTSALSASRTADLNRTIEAVRSAVWRCDLLFSSPLPVVEPVDRWFSTHLALVTPPFSRMHTRTHARTLNGLCLLRMPTPPRSR